MPKNNPPAPRNNQNKQPQQQQQPSLLTSQQWSGPLPPPAALEHFNRIIPNGAERIIAMVEREQAHRIQYENISLKSTATDTSRGHWLGWLISLAAIGGSVYTAHIGAPAIVSVALVSLPIATIITAFIRVKSKSN